jgi:uncharacterized membrane protein YhhN
VTLESSCPYLSIIAAVAARAFEGKAGSVRERMLKVCALGALALFSYFRGIAPTEIPAALTLAAIAEALPSGGAARWRSAGAVIRIGSRLVFAYLFLRIGEGRAAFLGDAVKAGLLVALLAAGGFGAARLWPAAGQARLGVAVDGGALLLMTATALTLYWSFWPAMLGALGAIICETLLLGAAFSKRLVDGPLLRRAAWICGYLGQAAMAYAFLR